MKIIDGKGAILGRLASYTAKELLKGEEVRVLNCKEIIISGNKEFFQNKMLERRGRVGSTQKGPKVSRLPHLIVKRTIRGMLPNYREGRGREALKRLKCYSDIPKEFENKEKILAGKNFKGKQMKVRELSK